MNNIEEEIKEFKSNLQNVKKISQDLDNSNTKINESGEKISKSSEKMEIKVEELKTVIEKLSNEQNKYNKELETKIIELLNINYKEITIKSFENLNEELSKNIKLCDDLKKLINENTQNLNNKYNEVISRNNFVKIFLVVNTVLIVLLLIVCMIK